MIGRDFELFGTNGNILRSFGDNQDSPFIGPVKVKFIDRNRVAVIDKEKGLHIQNLNGTIEAYIMPTKHELTPVELAREELKNKKKLEEDSSINTKDTGVAELSEIESVDESESLQEVNNGRNDSVDGGDVNGDIDEDGEPTNYMDVKILDLCTIPMTTNIVVSDLLSSSLKLVDRMNWVIERQLGEKREQFDEPQFKRISGISSFQLGFKVFYAVVERCNRLQILSEGGKTVQVLSRSGLLPGEFDDPSGVATYISPAFIEASKHRTPEPTWYMGKGNKEELAEDFEDMENKQPGDFLFVQRDTNDSVFDGKYMTPGGIIASVTVVKSKPERGIPSSAQLTMNASSVSMMAFPSVWDSVANCPSFVKVYIVA